MKVIFLDFDGVITTAKSRWDLDPDKLKLLGYLLKKTGAKIVVSSSWRHHTVEQTVEYLQSPDIRGGVTFPFCKEIVGVTIRASLYVKDIHLSIPRGVEVKQWIDANIYSEDGKHYHNNESFRYVILDDDSDMLLTQKDNFIRTHGLKGLSRTDVKKAIEILNR